MELSEKILNYLDLTKPGFFIEAGANDGIKQSNTFLLEKKFNWSGILVEPSYIAYQNCVKNREKSKVYNSCLVSEDYNFNFVQGDFDGNLMSSVSGKRLNRANNGVVSATTLQKLLDINNVEKIDFFSLDTEGYEYEVLKGIDFSKTVIEKILIEIYDSNKDQIFNFLNNMYKKPICLTNFNYIDNPNWDGTHNDYLFIRR